MEVIGSHFRRPVLVPFHFFHVIDLHVLGPAAAVQRVVIVGKSLMPDDAIFRGTAANAPPERQSQKFILLILQYRLKAVVEKLQKDKTVSRVASQLAQRIAGEPMVETAREGIPAFTKLAANILRSAPLLAIGPEPFPAAIPAFAGSGTRPLVRRNCRAGPEQ